MTIILAMLFGGTVGALIMAGFNNHSYNKGCVFGAEIGYKEGYKEGYEAGEEIGYHEGRIKGFEDKERIQKKFAVLKLKDGGTK